MGARHKLTAAFVKAAPAGKYCDGDGLWLHKRADGGAQWIFRFKLNGNRREMGLGSLKAVSLKQARELAEPARQLVAQGSDPIQARVQQTQEARRSDTTLRRMSEEAFEARKAELKGDGKAGRWYSPLALYVLPKLGSISVQNVNQRDIVDVLRPIWHSKADTAQKALNRLGIVLRHAAALGLDVDLQATDKAKALLGKSRHKVENIPAVAWRDVPAFYASLAEPSVTHLALRLLILTGSRSGPIRNIRLDEIDGGVWTIKGEAMKGRLGKTSDFRVPLSDEALRVIDLALPFARDGFLFPSARKGVISDATMSRLMERRGMVERPHGFRSSLRTWLAEATDASHEVSETVLAHTTGTSVSRVYIHTDMLEQRAVLMQRWADVVTSASGQVVQLEEAC
jgi:integrase